MKVPVWAWLAWALCFVVLEVIAVLDTQPNDSLTQTVLHHVPGIFVIAFLGWLCVHFGWRVWRGKRDGL